MIKYKITRQDRIDDAVGMTNLALEGTGHRVSLIKNPRGYEVALQKNKNKPRVVIKNISYNQAEKTLHLISIGAWEKEKYYRKLMGLEGVV